MTKPETRGKRRGFVHRAHAAPARRFIDASQKKIQQIAYDWDDLDPTVSTACNELGAALDEFERTLNDAIAYMREPADQD